MAEQDPSGNLRPGKNISTQKKGDIPMYTFLSILISLVLIIVLFLILPPGFVILILSGVFLGVFFRGVYLLTKIRELLMKNEPQTDKEQEAYIKF